MDRGEILEFCKTLKLDLVGFVKMRKFIELEDLFLKRKEWKAENEFEEKDIKKRIDPFTYMEDGKTIISIAFPYFFYDNGEENGFSVYTKGIDYHRVVHTYLDKICKFIEEKGGKAIPLVDSNTLPERYIAYLAGIGFIGKNNMLITKRYGSYVFLGEIITDLELVEKEERDLETLLKYSECGDCEICYKECPTKSINKFRKNTNICVSYLTQKKELTDKEISLLNGRIFGCDSCQKKCIYNEELEESKIPEFKPLNFMKVENLENIINMNNGIFKESFKNTSCGWRGKNILIRNAIIRKRKCKHEDIKDLKSESPYIKGYIDRLL